MNQSTIDLLQLVEDEDVKFIRLAYCDLNGRLRNMAIMSSELRRAVEEGISFDASAVPGFTGVEYSDLFLVPDTSTVSILPWRPAHERVMRMQCDVRKPDGSNFEPYCRNILRKAVDRAIDMGYIINIGTECEFYLFRLDEDGEPTLVPQDRAGYNDITPLDRGEDMRRKICLAIEDMGLAPECSHHECGPGQNEIDFRYADALQAADYFMTLKMAVKSLAQINDLFASFMPKPLLDDCGNGLHINFSLMRGGNYVFKSGGEHSEAGESFIAGILEKTPEITAFLNPTTNSYARLGTFKAPRCVTWSHQNRSQLIRIPAAKGKHVRAELRSADPSCNPYLAFALLIHAGLDGIENHTKLCAPYNGNAYEISDPSVRKLPENLGEALKLARESELVKRVLPEITRQEFFEQKEGEGKEYQLSSDRHGYETGKYFYVL